MIYDLWIILYNVRIKFVQLLYIVMAVWSMLTPVISDVSRSNTAGIQPSKFADKKRVFDVIFLGGIRMP